MGEKIQGLRKMLIIGFLITAPLLSYAQGVELTPFTGYSLRSTFNVPGGSVRVYGNHTFGGILTYNLNPEYGVEVMYSRQTTDLDVRSIFLTERGIPVAVIYVMGGGVRQFPVSDQIIPFAGAHIGAAGLVPQTRRYADEWRFAAGLKVGSKFMLSDLVGLRLQAMINAPIEGFGASFFVGGGGGGVGVDAYSTIIQFAFTGGLVFRLGL